MAATASSPSRFSTRLGRADANGNGLVELAELIQHVDGLVPAITEKRWGARQFPQMDAYGSNFALARQVSALAPGQGDAVVIPVKPTHVSIEPWQVFGRLAVATSCSNWRPSLRSPWSNPNGVGC